MRACVRSCVRACARAPQVRCACALASERACLRASRGGAGSLFFTFFNALTATLMSTLSTGVEASSSASASHEVSGCETRRI
eukprot:2526030-Pleurochrysis_carterae.AAC.1